VLPPLRLSLRGIERAGADARRARLALGREAEIEGADLRVARLAPSDVVVLLDVLHYLEEPVQERLLAAVADAVAPGGLVLAGGLTARSPLGCKPPHASPHQPVQARPAHGR